jgi:hypothetical protein
MTRSTTSRAGLFAVAALSLAFLGACGGGSSSGGSTTSGAGLSFQVRWERVRPIVVVDDGPPFHDPIPPSVSALRIIVRSRSFSCCLKIDPHDSVFAEQRRVVLTELPDGQAEVDVAGFPTATVPDDGITTTCAVKDPIGNGNACDRTACGQPSFAPAPVVVNLRAGTEAVAMPSPAAARPFVVFADPLCDVAAADNPVDVSLLVAQVLPLNPLDGCTCDDGVLECPRGEIGDPEVVDTGRPAEGSCSEVSATAPARRASFDVVEGPECCLDEPGCAESFSCCRTPDVVPPPDVDPLVGVRMQLRVFDLQPGCAEVRVPVDVFPGGSEAQVLRHAFVVAGTPAATPTLTPTPTVTVTPCCGDFS